MKFKKIYISSSLIFLLTACEFTDQLLTKHVIKQKLKDPGSAEFKEFGLYHDKKFACIKVNSKNSYGAYTGYTTYVLELNREMESLTKILNLDNDYTEGVYPTDLCSNGERGKKEYKKLICNRKIDTKGYYQKKLKDKNTSEEDRISMNNSIEDLDKEISKECNV